MRLVLLSLVVAALAAPAVGLADGSSASRSGAQRAVKASVKKAPKRTTKAAAKRAQIRAARLKAGRSGKAAAGQQSSSPKTGGSSSSSPAGEVEVKGAISALGATSITVGTQTCAIPTGMTLTGLAVGDLVELKCKLVAGVLTVVKVEREDDGQQGDAQGEAEVKGPIAALSATSITVGALTCAVPAGMSLGSLAVNDLVEMTCLAVAGTWTLKEIEREDGGSAQAGSDDDDDDSSGSGSGGDDDDDDGSGSGSGGDDD